MKDAYTRQRQLAEVGDVGQQRIRAARITIIGAGGLGCPAIAYLAAAGVGSLRIVDPDVVEVTNLHRQTLFGPDEVGVAKVEAVAAIVELNWPSVRLEAIQQRLTQRTASDMVAGSTLVLSCTDDLEAAYALSDACVSARIPLVHAAAAQWEGQLFVVRPGGPCLRCLHPEPGEPLTCETGGVMGPVPGILGAMQAQEALKLLVGMPPVELTLYDGRTATTRTIELKRRPGCRCSMIPETQGAACPAPWATPAAPVVDVADLPLLKDAYLLDVRENYEFEERHIPGSVLVPLGELTARLSEVPKNRRIVCVCSVGGRSARATEFLRNQGYDAVNLRGGMRAWLIQHG